MRLYFDRGTLVIAGSPAPELTPAGLRWDPRISAYRAPGYQYRAMLAAFRRLGHAIDDHVLPGLAPPGTWQTVDLRPYQHAALQTWARHQRGLVVLPTGSGKTRLACAVMALCKVRALCLVPTRALLHQWRSELARFYASPIGCLGDDSHTLEATTVATFESAYRAMERLGNQFELLIVDEAHHFGTGVRDEALEMCVAPRRLALTATSPDGEALARVTQLMGPRVCELSVADLSGLWLADFQCIDLRLRLSSDEQKRYDFAQAVFRSFFRHFRAMNPTGTWSDFTKFAARSESGRAAVAAFRTSRQITNYAEAKRAALAALLREHRAHKVLVFTSDNATAYAIAREHLIMPMTCDIGRAERERALAAFRAGELRALVSAQVLNEGIDVPDAEVAIIVGGTRGQREHVQRVGRLLRPRQGKSAIVYQLVLQGTHEARKAAHRTQALGVSAGKYAPA
jgi:superfamily II DNA or RNA helicase